MSEPTEHVLRNREAWTRANVEWTDASAREAWAQAEVTWGVFGVPESAVGVLGDVGGSDVLELGCGTAYVSAWLARRGARVVGLDVTPAQLDTARRMQREFGLDFPLVEASAEDVPLPGDSFDLVVSEHGASTWCDPEAWLSETARLLRERGRLVFLHTAPLATICFPDEGPVERELHRPYFGLHRLEWKGQIGVEYQLAHGAWIDVLLRNGLRIEQLVELQAPEGASEHEYYDAFSADWSRQWPSEEIWVAAKT